MTSLTSGPDDLMARKEPCNCFLVWSPDGTTEPKRVHETHKAALHEAYRLAGLFPGREFFVMMQASRPCVVQPEQVPA